MVRTRCLLVGAVLALGGCASAPQDPNAPQACIIVDNREGGGALGIVYLVEGRGDPGDMGRSANDILQGHTRIRIGQVTMGREVRECIRRSPLDGNYFLVAEGSVDRMDPANAQNQPAAIISQDFYLRAGETVRWDVRLNRITLEGTGGAG